MAKAPATGPVLYKPLDVPPFEAFQWDGADTLAALPVWLASRVHVTSGVLNVPVRSGTAAAFVGDWVTMEPDGTLAVVDNALFHATHEPVAQVDEAADNYVAVIPPRQRLVHAAGRVSPAKTNWVSAAQLKADADAQSASEAAAKQQATAQAASDKAAARTA
jgi:hypothetical protein